MPIFGIAEVGNVVVCLRARFFPFSLFPCICACLIRNSYFGAPPAVEHKPHVGIREFLSVVQGVKQHRELSLVQILFVDAL